MQRSPARALVLLSLLACGQPASAPKAAPALSDDRGEPPASVATDASAAAETSMPSRAADGEPLRPPHGTGTPLRIVERVFFRPSSSRSPRRARRAST